MWLQTADRSDQSGDTLQVCSTQFREYGGLPTASGIVRTVSCLEDSVLLKQVIEQDGTGHVLVIDGSGSMGRAIFGEKSTRIAIASGWEGIIVNGVIRDVAAIAELPISVKALGSNPRRALQNGHGVVDVQVIFGGVTFRPGAQLWSDDDGIVVEAVPSL